MALWEITVSLGKDGRGRWRQRTERVRGTYTNAKAKAAQMEAAVGRSGPVEDPKRTLAEALELYIRYAEKVKGRPRRSSGTSPSPGPSARGSVRSSSKS